MLNYLLFVIFPYTAVIIFFVMTFYRYANDKYSISSQSSQILGNKRSLIIGSWLFHWSIIIILVIHFLGIFTTGWFNAIVNDNNRETLEQIGWIFSSLLIIGMSILIVRRITNSRVRAVTSTMDWIIIFLIYFQVWLGFYNAYTTQWGSTLFINSLVPWLVSLFTFQPDFSSVAGLNWTWRYHVLNGFLIFALVPVTRLMHLMFYPYTYYWRKFQLVVWDRPKARDAPARKSIGKSYP